MFVGDFALQTDEALFSCVCGRRRRREQLLLLHDEAKRRDVLLCEQCSGTTRIWRCRACSCVAGGRRAASNAVCPRGCVTCPRCFSSFRADQVSDQCRKCHVTLQPPAEESKSEAQLYLQRLLGHSTRTLLLDDDEADVADWHFPAWPEERESCDVRAYLAMTGADSADRWQPCRLTTQTDHKRGRFAIRDQSGEIAEPHVLLEPSPSVPLTRSQSVTVTPASEARVHLPRVTAAIDGISTTDDTHVTVPVTVHLSPAARVARVTVCAPSTDTDIDIDCDSGNDLPVHVLVTTLDGATWHTDPVPGRRRYCRARRLCSTLLPETTVSLPASVTATVHVPVAASLACLTLLLQCRSLPSDDSSPSDTGAIRDGDSGDVHAMELFFRVPNRAV
ncbi:MAG: hypothetical protein MHM6MM_005342 [Cercozoa sp. M6MM]